LGSVETHKVGINKNDKEQELENDTPSTQAENVKKMETKKPLPEIDPMDTKHINVEIWDKQKIK